MSHLYLILLIKPYFMQWRRKYFWVHLKDQTKEGPPFSKENLKLLLALLPWRGVLSDLQKEWKEKAWYDQGWGLIGLVQSYPWDRRLQSLSRRPFLAVSLSFRVVRSCPRYIYFRFFWWQHLPYLAHLKQRYMRSNC